MSRLDKVIDKIHEVNLEHQLRLEVNYIFFDDIIEDLEGIELFFKIKKNYKTNPIQGINRYRLIKSIIESKYEQTDEINILT